MSYSVIWSSCRGYMSLAKILRSALGGGTGTA